MRRAMQFLGRAILELLRGLGLLVRDAHQALYRRWRARVWWWYAGAGLVAYLWATGQLLEIIFSLMVLALVCWGLWLMVSSPFRRARRREL